MLIQEKAKSLYEDLKKKHGKDSEGTSFNASHGWFHRLKARANLHNVKVSGEGASTDVVAAWEFPETEKLLMKAHIYLSRFLMCMRQDSTGRGCQTKVTSARRES